MNIELKRWKEKYIGQLQHSANNPDIACQLADAFHSPYTESDASEFVTARLYADDEREYSRAILIDDEVCGCIHMTVNQDIYSKSADITFWLSAEHQGKGVMTQAMKTFLQEIKAKKYDIVRLCAMPFAGNTGARCVLNNCGFELEGIMKKAACKNGTMHDICIYALMMAE